MALLPLGRGRGEWKRGEETRDHHNNMKVEKRDIARSKIRARKALHDKIRQSFPFSAH